jgi:type IV secretion system protein VirB8
MAWRVAGGAMVLAGISIAGASANMFVKRPNPPVVWSHDSRTGEVVQLRALSDGKIDLGKATDLHYLSLYINYRESYDWENIQDFYNATLQLSSEEEGKQYKKLMNPEPTNDKSPVNKYKKNFRVIAKAGPISWVGDTALVSYEKRIIPLNGVDKPFTEFWQATISRVYENVPKSDKDRGINVPGFRVTSFTPVRDMTRTAAETIPAANGGAP